MPVNPIHMRRLITVSLALVLFGPSLPGQQQPSFRSSTTLVQVDVIVRGKKGFVADLRQQDFQVLEDGVPQRIDQFYLVADPSLDAETPWTPEPPAAGEPDPLATERAGLTGRRVFVFVFDQPHLAFGNGRRAREAALAFLRDQFRPGDVGGVVVGRAMANRRLTSDRSELVAAVRAVPPAADAIALNEEYYRDWPRFRDAYEIFSVWSRDTDITDVVVARALAEGGGGLSSAEATARIVDPTSTPADLERREATTQRVVAKAQRGADEFRRTTRETLEILKTLMAGLAKIEGRKTVVVLSDGFVVEEALAPLREVEAAAARSDVRVYAIDSRGLGQGTVDGDLVTALQPEAIGAPRSPDIVFDGLAELASATGGYAVSRRNDILEAVAGIDRDTSSYYVLAYRPTQSKDDGRFRKIEVRVSRPGAQVRARRGYVAGR
jgi:VWFA-related protein